MYMQYNYMYFCLLLMVKHIVLNLVFFFGGGGGVESASFLFSALEELWYHVSHISCHWII